MANAALRLKVKNTYTKVGIKFFGVGNKIEFLERNSMQDGFNPIWEWNEGWWLDYDNFNRNFVLDGVDDDPEFAETIIVRATHLRLTANNDVINPVIYKIDRDKIEPPQGAEVSWTIRCDRVLRATNNFFSLAR